ncbi:MAG: BlaI/MecI/CopY family transcriptional regulator [Akkermansiaceae bacterium]|nr:BlaI/MecI/CopY family transcriptional regulator [Akkermansiaceae bacterium]
MDIVWRLRSCSAAEVVEIASERHGWAPTTVKTYLSILVDKGRLSAKKIGNSFLYRPRVSLRQSLWRVADNLLEKSIQGSGGPLLAYMIKKCELSPDEIAEIRRALDEAETDETSQEKGGAER